MSASAPSSDSRQSRCHSLLSHFPLRRRERTFWERAAEKSETAWRKPPAGGGYIRPTRRRRVHRTRSFCRTDTLVSKNERVRFSGNQPGKVWNEPHSGHKKCSDTVPEARATVQRARERCFFLRVLTGWLRRKTNYARLLRPRVWREAKRKKKLLISRQAIFTNLKINLIP